MIRITNNECPICGKPIACERDEIEPMPGDEDALCWREDCQKVAIREAFALAGAVMEAWSSSEELYNWHIYCEYIFGTKYPHKMPCLRK